MNNSSMKETMSDEERMKWEEEQKQRCAAIILKMILKYGPEVLEKNRKKMENEQKMKDKQNIA